MHRLGTAVACHMRERERLAFQRLSQVPHATLTSKRRRAHMRHQQRALSTACSEPMGRMLARPKRPLRSSTLKRSHGICQMPRACRPDTPSTATGCEQLVDTSEARQAQRRRLAMRGDAWRSLGPHVERGAVMPQLCAGHPQSGTKASAKAASTFRTLAVRSPDAHSGHTADELDRLQSKTASLRLRSG